VSEQRTAAGVALTQDLMDACAPIVDGRDTDLVIEAMGAAFTALLAAGQMHQRDARVVLHRYAERILDIAEGLDG
jgi:hypothetical protein